MNKDRSTRHRPRHRPKFLALRALILALIATPILFSPGSAAGQDMGDLLDGLNDAREVEKFAKDPGGYVKDKVTGEVKKRLTEAAFGPQMSPQMGDVFKRVFDRLNGVRLPGGKCPAAAHGNAWSVLWDLKTTGDAKWIFHTLLGIEGDIAGGNFPGLLAGKAKDAVEQWLRKYFSQRPPESYSITSTKGACTYVAVATIDYVRGTYDVLIAADCKCRPLILPGGGHGVVAGWRLSASGPATATPHDNFVAATIGELKSFKFAYNCHCVGDEPGLSPEGGSALQMVGETELQLVVDCNMMARRIAETEETLDKMRKVKRELSGDDDENVKRALDEVNNQINSRSLDQQGLLQDYSREWNVEEVPDSLLTPELDAYFRSALLRGGDGSYSAPNDSQQQQLDEKLDKAREDERQRKAREGEKVGSAWTPPTGTTRISVVGTLREEEVMITSRGSIGGTVTLETEDGEELAVAVPDEDGHFTIDFGAIAAGAEVATFILTALDSDGKAQARTTVEYVPGTPPEVMGPPAPTTPEIPYLQNHQLHELKGRNFGEGTEVVITDEQGEATLQETLSFSTDRIMYFLDGTVGPKEVQVWNELGSSEPFEIGVYEFGVTAGKTSLIRRETTSVTAFYDGLPAGTRIVFTNISKNVTVTPNREAEVAGNDITFTVGESAGEVSMHVSARQAGDWGLKYRLEFPVSR